MLHSEKVPGKFQIDMDQLFDQVLTCLLSKSMQELHLNGRSQRTKLTRISKASLKDSIPTRLPYMIPKLADVVAPTILHKSLQAINESHYSLAKHLARIFGKESEIQEIVQSQILFQNPFILIYELIILQSLFQKSLYCISESDFLQSSAYKKWETQSIESISGMVSPIFESHGEFVNSRSPIILRAHSARNLMKKDKDGGCHSYVVVQSTIGAHVSPTFKNNPDPKWDFQTPM